MEQWSGGCRQIASKKKRRAKGQEKPPGKHTKRKREVGGQERVQRAKESDRVKKIEWEERRKGSPVRRNQYTQPSKQAVSRLSKVGNEGKKSRKGE